MRHILLLLCSFFAVEIYSQQIACSSSQFDDEWEYAGPPSTANYDSTTPGLGLVHAIEMLPSDNNILFAASNTSGIYKSNDFGQTWYSVTDEMLHPGVGALSIAIDPTDDNIMYATTGSTSNGFGGFCLGVIKSEDQGENWYNLDLPEIRYQNHFRDYVLNSIKIDPSDPSKIIVGGYKKLFVSSDWGFSWDIKDSWNNSLEVNGYIQDSSEN